MNVSANFLRCIKNFSRKYCSDVFREELRVQTFCDIHVNVPYNVVIEPLDVHKEDNKLQIELTGASNPRGSIKHIQNGNSIKIFASSQKFDENATCNMKVPIKANLNITSRGNVSTGFFNGSELVVKSTKGDIFVEKFHGEHINLSAENGDIVLKGAVVAANIQAHVSQKGSIKTKRLQGLYAHLKANEGNISVDASYCDDSIFEAKSGKLELQNIHKNNKIRVDDGSLTLNGLDGQLEAQLRNSNADIQISRILGDSKIIMEKNGELILRLSEECQENTMFEIISRQHVLDQSVKSIPSTAGNCLYLSPIAEQYKYALIKSDGLVKIQQASWMSMLKLNVK